MLSYRLALLVALVAAVLSSPSEPAHRTFVAHARMGKQGRLGNQMFQWAAVLHASAVCQFEPSIAWTSLRGHGPPLAQGGSGHGLHLHSVFDFPSTKVVQMDAQAEARAPDNATAWQPSVFDCGRQPLLLSGYFQHVKYVRPVAAQLLDHFVFLEHDACSSAMHALRTSAHNPFVISVHVRRGDNVRVHNGPSITRAVHPAYIDRAVRRVLRRTALDGAREAAVALLFSDGAGDLEWCATHVKLPIPSVIPVYGIDATSARSVLMGFNITGCGQGVAPQWCEKGKLLPSQLGSMFSGGIGRLGGDGADLCLMSACDGWVLSPSTYGWWGAWLGAQRLSHQRHSVVLPLPWFNTFHATTGHLDATGLLWDDRWEWLELDSSSDVHDGAGCDAAIEFRQPDGGWRWNMSTGSFVFRFYVWSAQGGGVNCFVDDVLIGGPYAPFQDIKLEFAPQTMSPGKRVPSNRTQYVAYSAALMPLQEVLLEREDGSSYAAILLYIYV